ncbi:MAG: hypothetical protein Kow00123_05220 [Anaerolineales bacterium]
MATDEREALIERLVAKVRAWGLEAPAVFLLESHSPLSFLGSQALVFLEPLFRMAGQGRFAEDWAQALEDRDIVEQIVRRIEADSL